MNGFDARHLVACSLVVLLDAICGVGAAAMQAGQELSPEQHVEAVEQAVEKAKDGNKNSSAAEKRDVNVSGRFAAPEGKTIEAGHAHLIRPGVHSSVRVAEDGSFRATVPSQSRVFLVPLLDGFAARSFGPFDVSGEEFDAGTLDLSEGTGAEIRVTDSEGQPVAGATILSATLWVEPAPGRRSGVGISRLVGTASDAAGIVKLPHMAAGQPVELSLRKQGYQFDRREIDFADAAPPVWKLQTAKPTDGRVVDKASGKPVADAEVFLVRRDGFAKTGVRDPRNDFARSRQGDRGNLAAQPLAVTDDKGRFSIETWRDDSRYAIAILSPEHRPRVLEELASGQQLGEIALEPPLTLRGRLVGDLAKLSRRPGGQRTLAYRNNLRLRDESFSDLFTVPVASDGTFEIDQLLPGDVQLLMPGGAKHLRVTEPLDDLAIDLTKPSEPVADTHRAIHVSLKPTAGQPLRGEVRLSWSAPQESTKIQESPQHETFDASAGPIRWVAPIGATVWIHDVGLVGSRLSRSKLAVVTDGGGPQRMTVPVEPAGAVTGRVLSADGSPVPAFRLIVDKNLRRESAQMSIAAEHFRHSEGRFALTGLPLSAEDRYHLFAVVDGSAQAVTSEPFHVSADQPVAEVTVRLPPPSTLSGRVVDDRGEPVAEAAISVTAEQATESHSWSRSLGLRLETEPDGRFQFQVSGNQTDLEYELRVQPTAAHAGRTLRITPHQWPEDGQLGTLRLSRAATVRGRVLGEDGKPRGGVYVMLMPVDREAAEYRGHRSAQTDDDGSFRIEGVEPILQKLYLHGGGVIEVQGPFQWDRDEFDNPYWAVQPESAIDPATIIIGQ